MNIKENIYLNLLKPLTDDRDDTNTENSSVTIYKLQIVL